MTLLFYSAAQIDEDKRMKGGQERGRRDAGKSVGGSHLGTRLEARDYLTIMGVFSPYGVVPSVPSTLEQGLGQDQELVTAEAPTLLLLLPSPTEASNRLC